ncbi:MAG: ArsR/SmtB family transcription factor [Cyclobacteriaceae bacterium]
MTSFTADQLEFAQLAKALAHPARIAIIDYLIKQKNCVCGDIVGQLPLAQSTVSQHLKELKKVGLIKGEVEGVKVCYCLNIELWSHFQVLIEKRLTNIEITNCC